MKKRDDLQDFIETYRSVYKIDKNTIKYAKLVILCEKFWLNDTITSSNFQCQLDNIIKGE